MHYIQIKKQVTWAMHLGHNLDDRFKPRLTALRFMALPEEWKSFMGHLGRKYNEEVPQLKKCPLKKK